MPRYINVTKQKRGVHLPAATKAKFTRQVLMQKERGSIQMLHNLGEWRTPCLFHKTQTKPSCLQQDQNKRQCSEFLIHLKVVILVA